MIGKERIEVGFPVLARIISPRAEIIITEFENFLCELLLRSLRIFFVNYYY